VPFQTRPVTSWNGRVSITAPEGATPMMIDWPQQRCVHPPASCITLTLPVQSKEQSAPPILLSDRLQSALGTSVLNIRTAFTGLAPRAGLAIRIRLSPDPLNSRAELLARHHGVNFNPRIVLGVQACANVRKTGRTNLCHRRIPTADSLSHYIAQQGGSVVSHRTMR